MIIRNWTDCTPRVSHLSAIIWDVLVEKGNPERSGPEAVLEGFTSLTRHAMQGGKEGDYHDHDDWEQVYYFTRGQAKMKIDGEIHDVKAGDAVHLPPKAKHQLINDSDDWVEHLIISARVPTA
jgi:quercetin dioxygenase-like cupin family protein